MWEKENERAHEITIADVAQEAGVSQTTVSRVMNNKDHVRSDKRERVVQAIMKLGYVVNTPARSLAGGSSHVVGLLVNYLNTDYVVDIMRGIDTALQANHYDFVMYSAHTQYSQEAPYITKMTRRLAAGLTTADGRCISTPCASDIFLLCWLTISVMEKKGHRSPRPIFAVRTMV